MPRIMNKKHWPFQTPVECEDNDHYLDIIQWCNENSPGRWTHHGVTNYYGHGKDRDTFCFKNEHDYVVFLLRWV